MAATTASDFEILEQHVVEQFTKAGQRAGVRRVIYLGGLLPSNTAPSRHLASRLVVEEHLLRHFAEAVTFRSSMVVGAKSRSFRFLVRLVERTPLLPLPGWETNRTQPIDERDALAFLTAAAESDEVTEPLSLDIAGPDVMTYGEMALEITDALLVRRPAIRVKLKATPIAAPIVAAITGEDHGLIRPLMEGLDTDLLPRDDDAAARFGVRLHTYRASLERALREWELTEPLRAR